MKLVAEIKEAELSECEKLSKRIEEWNIIYPFMEWLQEHGIFLARHQTRAEAQEDGGWEFPYPIAVGKSIGQLLYEYFNVDPVKLEKERRELLEELAKRRTSR